MLNNGQAGIGSNGFFPSIDPAGLNEIVEVLETPSDEVLTSDLTPAPDGGRTFSHSHRPEELLEASFVPAWDLLLERVGRELTVIGSSEDPEVTLRTCACVCACVRVCAYLNDKAHLTVHQRTVLEQRVEGSQSSR